MKEYTTAELKSWLHFSVTIYAIGWIAYGIMVGLAHLHIQWIFTYYKVFIGIWIFGHLFFLDILQVYYELCKRSDKTQPHT